MGVGSLLERLKRGAGWLLAGFVGLAPAASASPAAAPAAEVRPAQEPRPAIWLLEDEDTKIYLFGTVHILPPQLVWRSPALDRIIAEADELVLEVSDRETMNDPQAALAPMMMGKSVSILSRVSYDRRAALAEMVQASGIPIQAYDAMHSWAAALTLAAWQVAEAYGRDSEGEVSGAETVLEAEFTRMAKPISGVETSAEQLGFLGGLPVAEQRAFLESVVDGYRFGAESELDAFADNHWLTGDVDALAEESEAMTPALYEALLTRRNANWTQWLAERLDRPGTVLFAVGAAHLAGRDSVQAMLARRGFTVTRIH